MYKQIRNFNIGRMGTKKGMCLGNVEDGFGIGKGERKYASAKADMLAQKAAGTLHPISTLPTNVAVPVYCDTASVYEHVIVSDHGVCYSDGKKVNLSSFKTFGWGECCGGARVVQWVADPAPAPQPTPSGQIKVGSKVTLTRWVDYNGKALKKTRSFYYVSQITGNRAVLRADSTKGAVYAAVNTSNLKLV